MKTVLDSLRNRHARYDSQVILNDHLTECQSSVNGMPGCERHQLVSQPCTDVVWHLAGGNLDQDGRDAGGGVLAWAWDAEHANQLMDGLRDCRFYTDLSVDRC